ncbi:MAG: hypothetical protein NE330_06905 [Lentisphaeraceae bacterium]|nr:hypothetical protein [Lentisphaeraceae bacterium]
MQKNILITICLLLLNSCSHTLAPTPALFRQKGYENPFKNLPEEKKSPMVDLVYVTDRVWDEESKSSGIGRARVAEYGECRVQFG